MALAASQPSLFDVKTLPGYSPLESALASPQPGRAASPHCKAAAAVVAKPSPRRGAAGSEDTSWVKTDDDCFAYFEAYGEKAQTQYFFCLPSLTGPPPTAAASSRPTTAFGSIPTAAAEFFLRVVPPEKIAHAPLYFIISPRQVVRMDAQRGIGGGAAARQTETLPVEQWLAHKRAFLKMRRLTFFSCFSLAKCWVQWRRTARGCVLLRRRRALQVALLPACVAFGEAFLSAQAALEGRLRMVRAASVQLGRRYTAEDWTEQQGAYRMRKVQPEVDAAVAALVKTAEAAVQRVEAMAEEFERTVQPAELLDRSGVDLHATTTKAKARPMQQIKRDKMERAAAYHRSLEERSQLPRFLRLLDFQLCTALADMAASSVAVVAAMLRAVAPGLLDSAGRGSEPDEVPGSGRSNGGNSARRRSRGGPAFFCSVVLAEDGSIAFSPSEAEWTAVVEAEVVGSSLHLAGSVPALLTLPAFQRYQTLLSDESWRGTEAEAQGEQQQQIGAADLAKQHAVFSGAVAELNGLLQASFTAAHQLAVQYQQYTDIQRFGAEFNFEEWTAQQREALDLPATDNLLRRLRGWQDQLEGMPLAGTAGLLHIDAADLHAKLSPVVASAQERVTGLLLQLAGERCREALSELTVWREVAGARPPELDGFLPWAGQLDAMQAGLEERLAAARAVDASLELVVTYAGRLPTADAVKRDDLREAVERLPEELGEAGEWQAEQCGTHAAAVTQQVAVLGEEAILLESEVQVGQFVDPGAPLDEVLADVEVLGARVAQMAAQAEGLGAVQQALGMTPDGFLEVREAGAAAQRCMALWHLVSDAEVLQAQLAEHAERGGAGGKQLEGAAGAVSALQERLAALRGTTDAPDTVWLRANSALYACRAALGE